MIEGRLALRFYPGKLYAAWVFPDHIWTVLSDGTQTRGYPPDDSGFLESAWSLGYGNDCYWHMVEHDLAHSWLTERLGLGHSVALWNQAHDEEAWLKPMPPDAEQDEYRVGALQAALNGKSWGCQRMTEFCGAEAFRIVEEAKALFRPDQQAMTREWAAASA